jgi:hypothetical protein
LATLDRVAHHITTIHAREGWACEVRLEASIESPVQSGQ